MYRTYMMQLLKNKAIVCFLSLEIQYIYRCLYWQYILWTMHTNHINISFNCTQLMSNRQYFVHQTFPKFLQKLILPGLTTISQPWGRSLSKYPSTTSVVTPKLSSGTNPDATQMTYSWKSSRQSTIIDLSSTVAKDIWVVERRRCTIRRHSVAIVLEAAATV